MAFLSIIVPTYNCEKTIGVCLQSLADQNFRDFEILIIDGLSSDSTIDYINKFFGNHPHLEHKVVSEKDKGIFDAMNKGAELARGEWLYFLGSDDRLVNNNILAQIYPNLIKENAAEFVYGNALLHDTGEIYDGKFSLRSILKANICHQTIFVKKALFNELGQFDLRYVVHADWDFNVKVFLANKKREFQDILVVYYGNQGYSSNNRDLLFEEKLHSIKEEYYEHFLNRLNSRYHYYKKRVKKFFSIK